MGDETASKILFGVKKNRELTAAEILRDENLNKKRLSERTIQRFLNKNGYKCRRKRKKVKMTSNKAADRLKFVKFAKRSQSINLKNLNFQMDVK